MAACVRLGLVGLGSVSQRGILPHLSQPDLRPMAELTAVCDVVRERAKASAEKFGVPHWYGDYKEMLAGPVDAVVIATPIGLHFEQALAAIEAGKHVHLNKTMTTNLDEANQLIDAAQKAGIKIVASPGQCFRPTFRTMRRLVEEGVAGKIYFAVNGRAWLGHEHEEFRKSGDVLTDINPAWYYQKGGGPMYDIGVYSLHEMTSVLGPAKRVTGLSGIGVPERLYQGGPIKVEMDDNTLLLIDFGDHLFAYLYATNSRGPALPGLSIFGIQASIVAQRRAVTVNGEEVLPTGEMPYLWGRHSELPESHVYSDIMHLVDCVLHDRKPIVSAEYARHVVEIMDKGYLASQTGQTQTLNTTFQLQPDLAQWGPMTRESAAA